MGNNCVCGKRKKQYDIVASDMQKTTNNAIIKIAMFFPPLGGLVESFISCFCFKSRNKWKINKTVTEEIG